MDRMSLNGQHPVAVRQGARSGTGPLSVQDALLAARQSFWLADQPTAFVDRLLATSSVRRYQGKELVIELDDCSKKIQKELPEEMEA